MSKAENGSNGSTDTQITCENDVILTVYGGEVNEYVDTREFVHELINNDDRVEIDLYEETTETHESVSLKIDIEEIVDTGFGDETIQYEETLSPYRTSEKAVLRKHFKDAELPDYITFVDEERTETCFVHYAINPIKTIVKDIIPDDAIEAHGFIEEDNSVYCNSWSRDIENNAIDASPDATITQKCSVSTGASSTIKPRQVLKPSDERSQGDLYTDGPDQWSFQVTARFEAVSGEELSSITENVIPIIQDKLTQLDGVDQVRVKKCEKQVEQHGACYDI